MRGGTGRGQHVVYVATSDNALSSVVRCNGAYVISAKSLIEEGEVARARTRRRSARAAGEGQVGGRNEGWRW